MVMLPMWRPLKTQMGVLSHHDLTFIDIYVVQIQKMLQCKKYTHAMTMGSFLQGYMTDCQPYVNIYKMVRDGVTHGVPLYAFS